MSAWPVTTRPEPRYCSFCGRSEHEADVLLAGPNDVFICDECIAGCAEIVLSKKRQRMTDCALSHPAKGEGGGDG